MTKNKCDRCREQRRECIGAAGEEDLSNCKRCEKGKISCSGRRPPLPRHPALPGRTEMNSTISAAPQKVVYNPPVAAFIPSWHLSSSPGHPNPDTTQPYHDGEVQWQMLSFGLEPELSVGINSMVPTQDFASYDNQLPRQAIEDQQIRANCAQGTTTTGQQQIYLDCTKRYGAQISMSVDVSNATIIDGVDEEVDIEGGKPWTWPWNEESR